MNYFWHYDKIVERARARKLSKEVYVERHHVVPVCIGGDNSKSNLVKLTAKEHYVAHQLLVKMYSDNLKLIYAVYAMGMSGKRQKRVSNKLYGWIRKRQAKAMSEEYKGKSTPKLVEHCRQLSLSRKGTPRPDVSERLKLQVGPLNSMYGKPSNMRGKPSAMKGKRNPGAAAAARLRSGPLHPCWGKSPWNKGVPNPTASEHCKRLNESRALKKKQDAKTRKIYLSRQADAICERFGV